MHWNGAMFVKERKGSTSNVVITVSSDSNSDSVRDAAVQRHRLHNRQFPVTELNDYLLLYADGTKADKIPGSHEDFTLAGYKAFLQRPYSKIKLYLATCSDYGMVIQLMNQLSLTVWIK